MGSTERTRGRLFQGLKKECERGMELPGQGIRDRLELREEPRTDLGSLHAP